MKIASLAFVWLLALPWLAQARLAAELENTRQVGQKCVLRFKFKNMFPQKVKSARAQLCLVDAQGKTLARTTRWVIGGPLGQPPLAPDQSAVYHFVLEPSGPCSAARLVFSRIVLEGGESTSGSAASWPIGKVDRAQPQ